MADFTYPWFARLSLGFLRNRPAVTALLGSPARIYIVDVPASPTAPYVRISPFGGPRELNYKGNDLLQFDVYGGDRATNHKIAETLCSELFGFTGLIDVTIGSTSEIGVVNGVDVGGITDDLDASTTPSRSHSRFDVVIYGHAATD